MNDSSEPPRILVVDDTFAIHRDFEKILCPPSSNSLSLMRNAIFDDDVSDLLQPSFQVDFALQGEEGCDMTGRAVAEGRPYSVAFIDVRMPPGRFGRPRAFAPRRNASPHGLRSGSPCETDAQ